MWVNGSASWFHIRIRLAVRSFWRVRRQVEDTSVNILSMIGPPGHEFYPTSTPCARSVDGQFPQNKSHHRISKVLFESSKQTSPRKLSTTAKDYLHWFSIIPDRTLCVPSRPNSALKFSFPYQSLARATQTWAQPSFALDYSHYTYS